jgi:hypothetical protein
MYRRFTFARKRRAMLNIHCVRLACRVTLHGKLLPNSARPPVSVYQNFARRL